MEVSMQRIGDIELDQDLDFEERQWRIQRMGWAVMALLVVVALLGLFGTGPLSSAEAGGEDAGLSIQYERFVRRHGLAELNVEAAAGQASEGQVEIWIAGDYLDAVDIQGISPEPAEVRASGDRQVYVFTVDDPEQPLQVSISYIPREMGGMSAEMGVGDSAGVSFSQLSYP
jgi:hypothetical protein